MSKELDYSDYVNIYDVEGDLAKDLLYWRAERPSEWLMDEFIRDAERLHRALIAAKDNAERYREQLEHLSEIAGNKEE